MTTLRQLIRWAEQRFVRSNLHFGHGADNALDEAAYLVLGALRLPSEPEQERLDGEITDFERQRIRELVDTRIRTRKPTAYLLRQAWFAGLLFYVDERVLIPRSPIAELIGARFSPWIKPTQVAHILELGTGSGCIAVACATAFPGATIDATDIDPDALEVAKINRDRHGMTERVNLIKTDMFSGLDNTEYDIIVSNPPYLSEEEMAVLPAEYRHEPPAALAAGTAGLELVERIVHAAHRHLAPHGILVVEVGQGRVALEAKYPRIPFIWLDLEYGGEGVFLLAGTDFIPPGGTGYPG